jgi:hypothetical protein
LLLAPLFAVYFILHCSAFIVFPAARLGACGFRLHPSSFRVYQPSGPDREQIGKSLMRTKLVDFRLESATSWVRFERLTGQMAPMPSSVEFRALCEFFAMVILRPDRLLASGFLLRPPVDRSSLLLHRSFHPEEF